MSNETDTSGADGTIESAYGLLESLVKGVLVLVFVVGWAGFWGTVVRIHYIEQAWIAMLLTAALGLAPVVGLLVWGVSADGFGSNVGAGTDVSTPS